MSSKPDTVRNTEKRPHPITIMQAFLAFVISAISAFIGWLGYSSAQGAHQKFPIAVTSTVDGEPLKGAVVSLNIPELNSESTDSEGRVTFSFSKDLSGKKGRLIVRKSGYQTLDQQLEINPRSDFYFVSLRPVASSPPTNSTGQIKSPFKLKSAGSADTTGMASPAITGDDNRISYGVPVISDDDLSRQHKDKEPRQQTSRAAHSIGPSSPAVSGSGNAIRYASPPSSAKERKNQ